MSAQVILIELARYALTSGGDGMPRAPRPALRPTQLGPRMIPIPLPWLMLDADIASQHRHFDCLHYDACLDAIAARAWRSFSCCTCPSFPAFRRGIIPSFNPEVICASADPTGESRRTE